MLDKIRKRLFGYPDAAGYQGERPVSIGGEMFKEIDSLERVLAASKDNRLLIFKHSTACPTSGRGRMEIEHFLEENPEWDAYLVVVQTQRPLSNEIEQTLGVRHETPQLLLVEDGRATLFWSHYQISKSTLESELK